ncbi:unnamed protein product [Dicrocoelium dendriticum]|nr:unnamed protein product [Dicrocoelium dendriticum]
MISGVVILCYLITVPTSLTKSFVNQAGYSTITTENSGPVSVVFHNGLPNLYVPLPSRKETCVFILKPLQHTLGDLASFIKSEDHGVDHVAFLNKDGVRIAKSNSVADLLSSEFQLVINNEKYSVCPPSRENSSCTAAADELADVKRLVTHLASTLHADEFHLQQQRNLERRIEDVCSQLEPFEQQKAQISEDCAKRTRRLTWLGLGAMGLQFGLLARLTWWEYSWDIMEPVTYFVGYGTSMAIYAYYVVTRQNYEFPQVFDREYLKRFYKLADRHSFDVHRYNELREQLADLKSELRRLRDPLLCNLPLQQVGYLIPEHVEDSVARGPVSFVSGTDNAQQFLTMVTAFFHQGDSCKDNGVFDAPVLSPPPVARLYFETGRR